MIRNIPEVTYLVGRRDVYYSSEKLQEGIKVEMLVIHIDGATSPKILLNEVGYGLYKTTYNFNTIGNYALVFFEKGKLKGHAIYRIST